MRVVHVAVHTLRETVRDRVFLVTLLFALLLIGGSVAVSPLAAGQRDRVIKDVGLASISIIGTLLAVFVGASLVHRETERRTIYTLLSRPLGRAEYVIGKYLGVVLTLALNVSIMAVFFGLLVHFLLKSLTMDHLAAIYLIGVELAVLAAFSILFSVLSSPVLSAAFTLSLFFVGHLAADIRRFAELLPPGLFRSLSAGAGYLLPNLEYFNAKGMAVYGKAVEPGLLVWATLYAAGYIVTAVGIAALVFRRKDLK
ncbi:MAG: ABC transporter permease [Candidatus Eisenbacteria bacterium]